MAYFSPPSPITRAFNRVLIS